jgi:hypothetical protein
MFGHGWNIPLQPMAEAEPLLSSLKQSGRKGRDILLIPTASCHDLIMAPMATPGETAVFRVWHHHDMDRRVKPQLSG